MPLRDLTVPKTQKEKALGWRKEGLSEFPKSILVREGWEVLLCRSISKKGYSPGTGGKSKRAIASVLVTARQGMT